MTSAPSAGSNGAAERAGQLLLVEDEESIGALVRAYLEQCGYSVEWARSGEEALRPNLNLYLS